MAYRRRYRKGGATGYARASYSEVYDMHTEFGKTTLIGVHTPVTSRWQYLLEGFVKQYKKFRYKGASLSFVPVATLPADPLQVSYEAGEPTIDPRDMMNPIIHCGMRGESMGNYLDEIFQMNISHHLNSLDVADLENSEHIQKLEDAYYSALMSPSFRKSHPQTGFRKSGLHPMVYGIATNQPYNYVIPSSYSAESTRLDDDSVGKPTIGIGSSSGFYTDAANDLFNAGDTDNSVSGYLSAQYTKSYFLGGDSTLYHAGQFFTNKLSSLGWLDTISRYTATGTLGLDYSTTENRFTGLPKVFMYFIMLPPAYKTEMYYRVVVKHYFEFKGFRTTCQPFAMNSGIGNLYDGEIQNDPATMDVATLDIYNGEANLVSDGVM